MVKYKLFSLIPAAILVSFIHSCSPLQNVQVEEKFGKRIAFIDEGSGSPTIILESGFDAGMETWGGIVDSLTHYARVYTYDRPGYGRSNKKDPPRTFKEVAQQLHTNLIARNIPPPYLLVGHADGALIVNMFARLYPDETQAALMIDPAHPDFYDYLRENEALIYDLLFDYIGKGQRRYEFDLIKDTSEDFKYAPEFPDIPLIVLMAGRHTTLESEALKAKTLEFHEDLKKMSSKGKRYLVEDSGYYIHKNNPNLIIENVLQLME